MGHALQSRVPSVVWVYDMETHEEVALLTGHTDWVSGVVYSPDGLTIASWSYDTTVRLWDAVTDEHKATLTGHTLDITSVVFSPDGFDARQCRVRRYAALFVRYSAFVGCRYR